MFDLDNTSHTVIDQSNAATNPYFVNTSFPTGTKVSRGVPVDVSRQVLRARVLFRTQPSKFCRKLESTQIIDVSRLLLRRFS